MRRSVHLVIVVMLISSVMPVFMSYEDGEVSAGTPDDGINGTQYIDGDWYVNDTQSYTDEEIILNGNLIINSGGHLTLNHVTLAMNCTYDGEYGIEIKDGGTLIVTDIDGDPATVNDFSNLTDSPFDTDNGSFDFDFEYGFMAYPGSSLTITNSIVREAGYGDQNGAYGIQSNSDNTTIENCTFSDNYYSIFLYNAMDYKVGNNDISNSDYGIYSYVSRGTMFQNDLGYNEYGIRIWGYDDEIRNNNVFFNNNFGMEINGNNLIVDGNTVNDNNYGIYAKFATNVRISNNEVFGNTLYGIYANDDQIYVHNNLVYQNQYGIYARGDNMDIYDNIAHNNTLVGLEISYLFDSEIFNNTLIYNGGTSWTHNLYIGFSDNLNIHNNIIQKVRPNSYHAVMMRDNSNIYFHDNLVDYNDDQAIRSDIGPNGDTNIQFYNNNISNNNGIGLFLWGRHSASNYVEVRNNVLFNNNGAGMELFKIQAYSVTNNTIISSSGWGLYIDDVAGGVCANNTISGSSYDFVLRDSYGSGSDTYFVVTNSTCDPSKTWIMSQSPTLIIKNYLHLEITDLNGPVPGANINIRDAFNTDVFQGVSDENGMVPFIELINITVDNIGTTQYDPYNITADVDIHTAYGEEEPLMGVSKKVKVKFSADLPPEAPKDLIARSNLTDVQLTWTPSYSPDLKFYEIYRNNSVGGWTFWATSSTYSYSDPDAASDWTTYGYKVRAVDLGASPSGFTDVASCGDWVVGNTQAYTGITIQLNGSLIILPTGDLTLNDIDLLFNCTLQVEFGIDVQPGGILRILDGDNDPITQSDQSVISSLNPGFNIYFKVLSDAFEMRNSKLSDCGTGDDLGISWWQPDDGAKVVDIGDPTVRGLYISSSNFIVQYNNFTNNFVSVLLDGVISGTISDNEFYDNDFGVYIYNSTGIILDKSTFVQNQVASVFVHNSDTIIVADNNLTGPSDYTFSFDTESGVALWGWTTANITVLNNNFKWFNIGCFVENIGGNSDLDTNYFTELSSAAEITNAPFISLIDNNVIDTSDTAFDIRNSQDLYISGGYISGTEGGYYIRSSDNIFISDVTVEDSNLGVVVYTCNNVEMTNVFANNCEGGIGIVGGNSVIVSDSLVENTLMGVLIYWGAENVTFYNTSIQNGTEQGFLAYDTRDAKLYNCSIDATLSNFNLTISSIHLYNTSYDQSRIALDNSSSIALFWLVDILVLDWLGAPEANANIQIRKPLGTLVYNGFCDSGGYIKSIWLHERTQYVFSNETSTPYFIQAVSGNHSGSISFFLNRSALATVVLENSAPVVSNVVITPTLPTTIFDLTLSYMFTDPENDPEGSSMIIWYIDGVQNSSFSNQMTIGGQYTKKDQTWFCEVIPHDGAVYGVPMTSTPVTIQNTAPTVSNVAIDKPAPTSSETLVVSYDFSDIDNDAEGLSLHRWYVDSGLGFVYSGVDSLELDSQYTQKGEIWKCIVTPSDGDELGTPGESIPVTIGNTAPGVSDLIITPAQPASNETLLPGYTFFDLDMDLESGSTIKWYKNTVEQTDLADIFSVDPAKTQKGEKWYYVLTPCDGTDFGAPTQSDAVVIANTQPLVSNIQIGPADPSTADDLIAEYTYFDEDGDPESDDTIIKWYRMRPGDIVFTYTGYQGATLSSTFTTKDEIWKCEVIPHDGWNYGSSLLSTQQITIGNSPPSAGDVYISPGELTTKNSLSANYEYQDLDSDPESGTEIRWFRDSVHDQTLDNLLSVSSEHTKKGEVWYFTVKPGDGLNSGTESISPSVTISNSAPEATDLEITPRFPLGDQKLVASYTYFDEDEDEEVAQEIRWYKNGVLQGFYNDMKEVESTATEKGDLWYFTLRVADGFVYSESYSSHFVEIANSQPVVNLISPAPSSLRLNETESLDFFVEVVDPDGDFLLFKWRLDKTSVGDNEYYQLITDYESAGNFVLNLSVQDIGENSFSLFYEWEIEIVDVNLLPQIEVREPTSPSPRMKEGTSLKFIIEESDPDPEDTLQITWYVDDGVAQTGGSSYTYVANDLAAGWHDVRAVVDDGTDSTEYAWDLHVEDVRSEELFGLSYDFWGLLMAIISGAVAILLFVISFVRVKKKKGALKTYMAEIDEISTSQEDNPQEYEMKINEIEDNINTDFKAGNIEDLHYLMLQEILTTRRGHMRRAAITQKFKKLPEGVTNELDDMLADGKITKAEYENFVATISLTKSLTGDQKRELSKMIEKWEFEDKDIIKEGEDSEKVEPKKEEIDEETKDMVSSLDEEKE